MHFQETLEGLTEEDLFNAADQARADMLKDFTKHFSSQDGSETGDKVSD